MAIKGSLGEASLPDVFQLLAMGQKSGCLSVTDRSAFGSIYFERGRITYAAMVNRRDRLGDLLVKNGLIDGSDLSAAVDAQGEHPDRRLGEILIERGAITPDQLEQYIRLQIEEAVFHLFTWAQGSFYFEPGQKPDPEAMLVSINPENLLLEGARRIDEWSQIETRISSLDLIFEAEPDRRLEGIALAEEQRKILPLLDGRRTVQEVADDAGLVEFDTAKALFGLLQAGLARAAGRREAAGPAVPPARVEEHRNLGVAFYRTGMYEEATREFRRVRELDPDAVDARFHLALIALRTGAWDEAVQGLQEVLETGGMRSSVLCDLAIALERTGRLREAELVVEEALRAAPDYAPALLSRGILLWKRGDAFGAAEAFRRYRAELGDARPPAVYFAFATLAEAATARSDGAIRLGTYGVELHPHSIPVLLHLGAVRERRGEWQAAEELYRRAVDQPDPPAQAFKALGDALYHRGAYDEATRMLERAVDAAPDLGDDVFFKLGNLAYKRIDRQRAVELWRRALELNPAHHVARTNLELIEHTLGRSTAAAV